MLAVCPNSSEIWIYEGCHNPDSSTWTKKWVLTEHDLVVTSIDWSPVTNKIVSCAHDRNAFVWTFNPEEGKWDPALVILRINRAALDAQWSLDGNKFAVGSGAKCVPICNYEEENSWWISKMIKKPGNAGSNKNAMFKLSVKCLAWHPNNELIATGATDFHTRVFSATIEGLDGGADHGFLGGRQPFGHLLYIRRSTGWVEAVAWSPSGNVLAACGHDATIAITNFETGAPVEHTVALSGLPCTSAQFLADDTLVAAGYEFKPMLITQSGAGGSWEFNQFLDKEKKAATGARKTSDFASARSLFESKVSRGQDLAKKSDKLLTKHENAVTDMVNMGSGFVSTVATDGKLVIWNMAECCT